MTFGQFSAMTINDLAMCLQVLTHFRNRCAHIKRMFSYKDLHDIPDTKLHQKLGIKMKGSQYVCGKHDLFAVVIAYRYLLPKDDFKAFKRSLKKLIRVTVSKANTLTEEDLLGSMGFPENWEKASRYKV